MMSMVTTLEASLVSCGEQGCVVAGARADLEDAVAWLDGELLEHHGDDERCRRAGQGRLEVFEGAGHFSPHDDPLRFVSVLRDFLATTAPNEFSPHRWRHTLNSGPGPEPVGTTGPADAAQSSGS